MTKEETIAEVTPALTALIEAAYNRGFAAGTESAREAIKSSLEAGGTHFGLTMTDEQRMRATEGSGAALARSMGRVVTGKETFGFIPAKSPGDTDA